MRRPFTFATLAALALSACAENPADSVPKAEISAPAAIVEKTAAVTPAGTPAASAGALVIAPDTSKVEFIGSKVTGSHSGGFKAFNGTAELTPDKSALASIKVDIDMNSTWADDEKLTGHLKAPDFFDVAKFPKSTFETTEIKPGGDKGATHTITGNLILHGVTKAITFPAKVEFKDDGVTITSEFAINRKDFGIVYGGQTDNLIRDEVVIKLNVKAPKKA